MYCTLGMLYASWSTTSQSAIDNYIGKNLSVMIGKDILRLAQCLQCKISNWYIEKF
jgi:hypothetical protein